MAEETKPAIKKSETRIKESQRVLNIISDSQTSETPMTPYEINLMVELAMLDKLEEICLLLKGK